MKKFESVDHAIGFLRKGCPTSLKSFDLSEKNSTSREDREDLQWTWAITRLCLKTTFEKVSHLKQGHQKNLAFAAYYLEQNAYSSTVEMAKKLHVKEKTFFRYLTEVRDLFENELIKKELMHERKDN